MTGYYSFYIPFKHILTSDIKRITTLTLVLGICESTHLERFLICEIILTDLIQATVNTCILFTGSTLFLIHISSVVVAVGGGAGIKMRICVWLKDPENKKVQCCIWHENYLQRETVIFHIRTNDIIKNFDYMIFTLLIKKVHK